MIKTIVLLVAVVWVVVMALAIKLVFFPSAKDAYFAMDQRVLQQAPGGLAVLRPTHFSMSVFRRGIIYTSGRGSRGASRIMGRDVSLKDLVAAAWGKNAARVVMPPGAPTNNFDFIVTVGDPRKVLQRAIHRQLGYTADTQTLATDVLALKVENSALPGFVVSGAGETENVNFKKGNLYITHMQLKKLSEGFEQMLKTPVVDETGLTNYYDFSLEWNAQLLARLGREATARPALDKILSDWGMGLEPDTVSLEMLVVKKMY